MSLNMMERIKLQQNIILNNNLIDKMFCICFCSDICEAIKDSAVLAPLSKDVAKNNKDEVKNIRNDR